jgi:hypothetical protein
VSSQNVDLQGGRELLFYQLRIHIPKDVSRESFPRKRESSEDFWMPVSTGMTILLDTPWLDAGSPLAFQTKNGDSIQGTGNGQRISGLKKE